MDGKWHPVAFYSKLLSSVEQNYKIYNKVTARLLKPHPKIGFNR